MKDQYPSQWLERAVDQLSLLPGIGRKTAMRMALHLLRQPPSYAQHLGEAIIDLRQKICYCERCHCISDSPLCDICSDPQRDQSVVCVVEQVKDVLTIEQTHRYKGLYHVLGGIISPIDGITPNDLEIESLYERVQEEPVREVILAIRSTLEGDTTNYYIYKRLESTGVLVSLIARGISIGDEIEYADEVTLGSAIANRTPFDQVK